MSLHSMLRVDLKKCQWRCNKFRGQVLFQFEDHCEMFMFYAANLDIAVPLNAVHLGYIFLPQSSMRLLGHPAGQPKGGLSCPFGNHGIW